MSKNVSAEYISIGANRHSTAADWSSGYDVLAYGADQSVALWRPLGDHGVSALLKGHTGKVSAVRFLKYDKDRDAVLLSGSADGELRLWQQKESPQAWTCAAARQAHEGALNTIAVLENSRHFLTGGADSTVEVWRLEADDLNFVQSIKLKPRFLPLSLVIGSFPGVNTEECLFFAVGGTRNDVQIHVVKDLHSTPRVEHQATLSGHESWIRSLSLSKATKENGLLLASASHDKYVRLWRLQVDDTNHAKSSLGADAAPMQQNLTAKVQKVSVPAASFSVTFEALLLGHEDWVYTAAWNPVSDTQQLLTASADGSLAIWEPDTSSGIWVSTTRLGEISDQKGATTATGSAGGFWTGLWSPDGQSVTCLGRTGSWRVWRYDTQSQFWVQRVGVSGHVGSVNGLTWSKSGSYLLSTSSDQTTRLHAEWKRGEKRSWHEFARPQIHGYDLNCVASTKEHQFASGADEKLLRVFDEPKSVAKMLASLCKIEPSTDDSMPETAAMPALGLSNKAVEDAIDTNGDIDEDVNSTIEPANVAGASLLVIDEPPTEDLLARHTLWPEHEKLYGHGYEISEAATSTDGGILATACKASSVDHAVIRLYDTASWHEIKPPLSSHSLTVTRLAFSCEPDHYLLSVGRDRQWAVFRQTNTGDRTWKLVQSNAKAHTRMILDAAWSPYHNKVFFATAGRDKTVKTWLRRQSGEQEDFVHRTTVTRKSAVTALSYVGIYGQDRACLAVGEEDGTLSVHIFNVSEDVETVATVEVAADQCPSKAINRLAWRTDGGKLLSDARRAQLAVASADGSVRIMSIDLEGEQGDTTNDASH